LSEGDKAITYNPQNPDGQANSANSSPVVIASDQSAVAHNLTQVSGVSVSTAASGIQKVGVSDGSGNTISSTANALDVNIKSGGGSGVSTSDEAVWTAGTSAFNPVGGVFNDTAAALTSGQEGTVRTTANRGLHTNIRNAAGTELATSGNPLRIDPTGTTTQPVSGSVTANAGTGTFTVSDGALELSQGTVTSGQKGPLVQAAVTTGAPSYTTAQTSPLSLDTSGNLRTSVSNTVTVSGTVTTSPPLNASVNLNQVAGNAIATAASGIAKVGLTDGAGTAINSTSNALNVNMQNASVAVTESGTWTVQPGNTPNTAPWLVSLNPPTSGGWSVSSQTGLTNTVVSIKASAGQFGGYMFNNPNAGVAYIQIFNVVSGSVTLGTTTPTYVIPIPGAASANVEFTIGIAHGTAISAAVTTTATGSTALGAALTGFFVYK
jgi:hypothetical protein